VNDATAVAGEILWVIGVVAWYVIRYPFERRAKRVRVVTSRRSGSEIVGLVAAVLGMAVVPAVHVATGIPESADYPPQIGAIVLGAFVYAAALWLFRRSHKELGRNWSITLEIRENHKLIRTGPYALVRHPMYTSFLLMAVGQALLVPNWAVGIAGLLGFAVLAVLRIGTEERMMLETFGEPYVAYMGETKRIVPFVY
jgi:protein-S-isoprenylcysteine O-methyltransferase Ste14